jgi:hypothetical protein
VLIFEKVLKHDKYVFSLCSTLNALYDKIETHVPLYSSKRRLVGEIDILAFKNGICDIYEVKCSHRISKAKRQLKKLRKLMSLRLKVGKTFFFCGESNVLITI